MSYRPSLQRAAVGLLALLFSGLLALSGCGESKAIQKARANTERGYDLIDQQRWNEALVAFQQANADAPHFMPAKVGVGLMHSLEGKHDEAEAVFTTVLEEEPDCAEAYREWGMMLARQGHFAQADEKLAKALELNRKDARSLRGRAMLLGVMGKDEEAIALFEESDGMQPEPDAIAFLHWGSALSRLGRHDDARAKYEAGLRRAPGEPTLMNNLGLNLVQTGKAPESGVKLLERAVELRGGDPEVLHNLGWAYLQTGRFEQAKPVLEQALAATDPTLPVYAVRKEHLRLASAAGEAEQEALADPAAEKEALAVK